MESVQHKESYLKFVEYIKSGKSSGSYVMAKKTVVFLQEFITNSNSTSIRELIDEIKKVGQALARVDSTETVIGNIVLRVLKLIRDEYNHFRGSAEDRYDADESLQKVVTTTDSSNEFDVSVQLDNIKDAICIAIGELMSELETCGNNISDQSLEHIYTDEVVMTIGRSKTVESFLKFASKHKRKFQVIIAECAPFYNGHDLSISLAKEGIRTILIPDSAIFSVMSRVNKVIIGTHSIMANGGIKAVSGAYTLALAAKHYSVPFIVCTGMYKLTPKYLVNHDQLAFNKFSSPQDILAYELDDCTKCQVINPVFDYVPPELITIFVSNIGGNSPSYVYRLLSELYHPHDDLD